MIPAERRWVMLKSVRSLTSGVAMLAGAALLMLGCDGTATGELPASDGSVIHLRNFSSADTSNAEESGQTGMLRQGLNYTTGFSLFGGSGVLFKPSGLASNQTYFATLTPTKGNPDLTRYSWTGLGWLYRGTSTNGALYVDRMQGTGFGSSDYFYVASNVDAGFSLSVSWEVGNRLELDVPYFSQYEIPVIGPSACASTSAAMILAYQAKIRADKNSMITAAQSCFAATSGPEGLRGKDVLIDYLQGTYSLAIGYDESSSAQIFSAIQTEIRAGRPVILGSRAFSSAGHYIVVTGFNGNDYRTATIIANDPNGRWRGCGGGTYCYDTGSYAKGVEYNFSVIMSSSPRKIFTLRP